VLNYNLREREREGERERQRDDNDDVVLVMGVKNIPQNLQYLVVFFVDN
jgi:hypothetical protein